MIYPNPFKDKINIHLGNKDSDSVHVIIYSYVGQIVMSTSLPTNNGAITIDGDRLLSGMYFVYLYTL